MAGVPRQTQAQSMGSTVSRGIEERSKVRNREYGVLWEESKCQVSIDDVPELNRSPGDSLVRNLPSSDLLPFLLLNVFFIF